MHHLVKRRAFLGATLGVAACGGRRTASGFRYFTAAEARTVEAITAQLIPADQDAGAREAGVVHYIDLQLVKRFRRHRPAYTQGLARLDQIARTRFEHEFAALNDAQQMDTLKTLEKDAPEFFGLILGHTRQGFYGDPRHGGNRGRVSWKMVGLPFPQVRGREHYEVS